MRVGFMSLDISRPIEQRTHIIRISFFAGAIITDSCVKKIGKRTLPVEARNIPLFLMIARGKAVEGTRYIVAAVRRERHACEK